MKLQGNTLSKLASQMFTIFNILLLLLGISAAIVVGINRPHQLWIALIVLAVIIFMVVNALLKEGFITSTFVMDPNGIRVFCLIPRFRRSMRWEDITYIGCKPLAKGAFRYYSPKENMKHYLIVAGEVPSEIDITQPNIILLYAHDKVGTMLEIHRPDLFGQEVYEQDDDYFQS